jgi:tetratricopeptide (TPR) repeat protein
VYELQHDWKVADAHYSKFARAAERLAKSGPTNVTYLGEAAAANMDLGAVRYGRGEYGAAEAFYQRARKMLDEAAQLKPGYSHTLFSQTKVYRRLAETFSARKLWSDALLWRQRQYDLASGMLSRTPDNFEVQYAFASAERGLGSTYWALRDRRRASDHLSRGFKVATILTTQDPKNSDWRAVRQQLSADIVDAKLDGPLGIASAELKTEANAASKPACTTRLKRSPTHISPISRLK